MNITELPWFEDFANNSKFNISTNGYIQADKGWKQMAWPQIGSRLYYIIEGSVKVFYDDKQINLEKGYLYFIPKGVQTGFSCDNYLEKLYFHFTITLPNGYDIFINCKHIEKIPFSDTKMKQMKEWYFSKDAYKLAMLKAQIWNDIGVFLAKFAPTDELRTEYSKTVQDAIDYIQANLTASLRLSTVASALFCSENTLEKKFRSELFTTVAKYIEDMIMFKAQKLLMEDDISINQISSALGFCDQFYFSRRFSKRFSMSPNNYRKYARKIK